MKRIIFVLALACACAALAFSEGTDSGGPSRETTLELQGDYGFPNHEAVDASGLVPIAYSVSSGASASERDVGSSWGSAEAKAILDYKLTFPVLVGSGELTKGNKLALDFSGELSPVSLNANFQATLTPIAFLQFAAGAGIGTGWDIGFIGLGTNNNGTIESQPFGGVIYRAWLQGTFQFDLAALVPGEWNHVVVVASPKVLYQAYSKADANTPWIWEADDGMNYNGLALDGSYFLGYQMPLALDTVGILLQTEGWLGSVRDKSAGSAGGWGSDFTYCTFGPLFDFKINDASNIAVLPQFKTGIKWNDATTRNLFFADRVYEGTYLYFYRLAFDYTLKL